MLEEILYPFSAEWFEEHYEDFTDLFKLTIDYVMKKKGGER